MKPAMGHLGLSLLTALCMLVMLCSSLPAQAQFLNEFKITASDGAAVNRFGASVAIDGDLAIVGAINDDDNGTGSGSAYIYQRNAAGDKWTEIAKLLASDGATGDSFGWSVAIDGDIVIVGAPLDDDLGNNSGSAYIFARNQGGADNWGQVKKLLASDGAADDSFGHAVGISGYIALVGASGDSDLGLYSGSAYVFYQGHGGIDNWGEMVKVTASDGAAYDSFGISVSIDGDYAIVGVSGDDDLGNGSGSAYVLTRNSGGPDNWGEAKKITASDGGLYNQFGCSVDMDGELAIVGAHRDDDHGANTGSAYIFSRDLGGLDNWGEVQKMVPVDLISNDYFGNSVGISGDIAIAGAWKDSIHSVYGDDAGSAYTYSRDEGGADNWGQTRKITPYTQGDYDQFGVGVGVSGETVIVGARQHNSSTGAAYCFNQPTGAHINTAPDPSFATVIGDTTDPATVTIYSVGTAALTVNGISDPGGEFILSNLPTLPAVLSPGDTLSFDVQYAPVDAGSDSADVDVSSDDLNDLTKAVHLTGTAHNPAQPGVGYGSTGDADDGRILTIDLDTGAATLLADIEYADDLTGLAIDSVGRIIAHDYDDYILYWIDGVTGDVIQEVDTSEYFTSIAFDENDVLYACYEDYLYTLDLETGDETEIASMDDYMAGLAFDPTDGTLYASVDEDGDEPDAIYIVDKTNGDTTLVGYTGLGESTPDIAFDADGNLYGVKGGEDSSDNELIAINKATGAGTVIGYTGFTSIGGLDIGRPTASLTVSTGLTCLPSSGTVPFSTTISVTINNQYSGQIRRMAAVINVALANGSTVNNWRAGYTNIAAGDTYSANWANTIPATGSVIGINTFTLLAEDVTPSPYNQPPYPAAGDTDSDACTVEGIAP